MAIEDEFKRISKETAAVFEETLVSIAAAFGEKLREETKTLDESQKTLLRNFKNQIAATGRSASSLLDIQDKLRDGSLKEATSQKAISSIQSRINQLTVTQLALKRAGVKLSSTDEENALNALSAAKSQKLELEQISNVQKDISKELGTVGAAATILDKIFKQIGLDNPFGAALEQTRAAKASIALNNIEINKLRDASGKIPKEYRKAAIELSKQNQKLKKQTSLTSNLGKEIKEQLTVTNGLNLLGAAIATKILSQALALNEAQTDSVRLTGERVKVQDQINSGLLLATDYLKQVNALTEQFGLNTTYAFDQVNIAEAAELTKFLGLSANESGVLARNAQISGENLKDGADQAIRAINPAFSQKKILQDIAKLSASITTSFGNSNVALAKAASDAKELGLNLDQVDKIAGGLLDIESSIAAEFEAEVISGKQLNLERARYFALTNDLAGVTKELTNQGITQESFAKSNRIEQEAVAKAIGLSRDELAASLQEQALLAGMSTSEIEAKEAADLKRLSAQQSLNDSIAKMAEVLAVPAELFANMLNNLSFMLPLVIGVGVALKTMAAVEAAIIGFQKIKNNLKKKELATEVGIATAKSVGNPIAAVAGLAAGAIVAGFLGAYMFADDMVSPKGYGKRVLTGPEGSIALNNNDTVIAGTNLGQTINPPPPPSISITPDIIREENRNNNPTIDYNQLADAIAMGAEKGTSRANITTNLDGSKVSNRIQAPLAVNTRKYSV